MTSSAPSPSSRSRADRALTLALVSGAIVSASIVLVIFAFVALGAWPALREIGPVRFLTDARWLPSSGEFGLAPMLAASVATTGGAVLVAAPLGLASALFTRLWAPPRVGLIHRRLVELAAGVPSVVYGLWGLVVLVPILAPLGGSGQSLLAATIVLALMLLPTVALTADAALAAVPTALVTGAAALGLGRWVTARSVLLPAARAGVASGVLLAVARGLGETMAVLMVSGNDVRWPTSPIEPVRTLNANIALEMGYATEAHRAVLYVSGLMLLASVALTWTVVALLRGGPRRA